MSDSECTHLVVDNVKALPADIRSHVSIVKPEWFWASVQMEICADDRVYAVTVVSILSVSTTMSRSTGYSSHFSYGLHSQDGKENNTSRSTPSKTRYSLTRSKKRKRYLKENLAALAIEGEVTPGSVGSSSYKSRRSSADQLSVSYNMSADVTPDSSACLLGKTDDLPMTLTLVASSHSYSVSVEV